MHDSANRDLRWLVWAKWIAFASTTSLLLFDSAGKLLTIAPVVEGTMRLGYGRHHVFWVGLVEAACTVAFVAPRTSFLGAILLTGYLGGATATHVRLDEPFVFPIIAGAIIWLTLLLRSTDARNFALRSITGEAS